MLFLPWPSCFVRTLPSLRPSSLGLALGPESPNPGDAEGGKPVNRAVPNQSGTVRGCEDALHGYL